MRWDNEQAKQQDLSASLLEQHRPNVFQMNVANILPGDEIRIELAYTERQVPTEGTYAFFYPTVVGPRYAGRAGTESTTGEPWVANPYTHAGQKPTTTFDFEVRLSAALSMWLLADQKLPDGAYAIGTNALPTHLASAMKAFLEGIFGTVSMPLLWYTFGLGVMLSIVLRMVELPALGMYLPI